MHLADWLSGPFASSVPAPLLLPSHSAPVASSCHCRLPVHSFAYHAPSVADVSIMLASTSAGTAPDNLFISAMPASHCQPPHAVVTGRMAILRVTNAAHASLPLGKRPFARLRRHVSHRWLGRSGDVGAADRGGRRVSAAQCYHTGLDQCDNTLAPLPV
jgi:hypothetical protein